MFLFLDISGGEILVILVVVFLIFGPSKLPEVSRKIGRAMNDLKRASSDIRREIQQGASDATRDFRDAKDKISGDIADPGKKTKGNDKNQQNDEATRDSKPDA